MLKKMLISTGIMGLIIFLFLFVFVSGSIFGKQKQEEKEISYSFLNDQYYYYLTDKEIESAISAGIESLHSIDNYLLVEKNNTLSNKEDILFSYIETPKLTVGNIARNIYQQYSRKVRTSEAKLDLTDEYLPLVSRFHENKGYIYDIYFVQNGEKLEPYTTEVKNQGGMVSAYFLVENIDFEQPGELHLLDTLNEEIGLSYQIDFASYR